MLEIYKNLFDQLNNSKIAYSVYKSLNHLDEDLNGIRGDIDILLNEKDIDSFDSIALNNNFFKVQKKDKPYYYMGIDKITHKFVMLDVNIQIQFGPKPYKPYSFFIEVDKISSRIEYDRVKVLDLVDYVPLMFIMRVASLSEREQDLIELQELIKVHKIENSYILSILKEKFSLDWNIVSQDILKSRSWQELKEKYLVIVIKHANKNNELSFKQKYKFFFGKIKGIQRKLKFPAYKIRNKGFLVAFVGVDGAGKSSTVEYIQNLEFFKNTGIKRIYFGNNEYWIPGLQILLKKEVKNKFLKLLLGTLSLIDRQLRIFIALYYMQLGNIVLADRYIYDDEIGRIQNKENNDKKPLIKRIYQKIFGVRMLKKPELTIFLDVSPEVAYSRKQDYSFEKMLEVNKDYKDYMYKVDGVKIVNADQSQERIYSEIINFILDLEK
ncbi:dTMP kinase [Aliarcobacter cryaerophilus]|uniref:dTMP kinase n=1 Tax=Aliarcobacter cryaerophilus TaxID=28198 RepID=UPI003DA580AF